MRTGTHYFPRAGGIVTASDAGRVKFALNKIDETPASMPVSKMPKATPPTATSHSANISGQYVAKPLHPMTVNQRQQLLHPQMPSPPMPTPTPAVQSVASQRRLESMSCEMARRHFPAIVQRPTTSQLTSDTTTTTTTSTSTMMGHPNGPVMSLANKHVSNTSAAAAVGQSPDVQRRLSVQSYRGMECTFVCVACRFASIMYSFRVCFVVCSQHHRRANGVASGRIRGFPASIRPSWRA